MAVNAALEEYQVLELQKVEDLGIIKNITNAIKNDFVNYYSVNKEEANKDEFNKLISLVQMSLKSYANIYYKKTISLYHADIEQIKLTLNNYANKSRELAEFKQAIISDLTSFQRDIRNKHVEKIEELRQEKKYYEKQIVSLENEKNKLIMDRLSKIAWPYDKTTKEYEVKIEVLQLKVKRCEKSIAELKDVTPHANEKDILMYKMHLQEKFCKD